MVTVDYSGQYGNQMFQYAIARELARRNGLAMGSGWPNYKFIAPTTDNSAVVSVKDDPKGIVRLTDHYNRMKMPHTILHRGYRNRRIHIKGYWQYKEIWEQVDPLKIFDPGRTKREPRGIACHFRLTDYRSPALQSVIHPSWYRGLLESLMSAGRYEKIVFFTDNQHDSIFEHFKDFNYAFADGTPAQDFHRMRGFDTILVGNSTFSWWAAYLGMAQGFVRKVYTFEDWFKHPDGTPINLAHYKGFTPVKGRFEV